ncbi:hypothetical protein [Methanolapillus millepedarum]|uniref:Uncharacterized protein n=1 Tax=Methanolapillus millepedarum TaxID=3028296 RepID=A0AA97A4Y7_9EURY|nr:hypothetical protein MsAc7_17410 [Methanosarcinaceae archaeon Ac7]
MFVLHLYEAGSISDVPAGYYVDTIRLRDGRTKRLAERCISKRSRRYRSFKGAETRGRNLMEMFSGIIVAVDIV